MSHFLRLASGLWSDFSSYFLGFGCLSSEQLRNCTAKGLERKRKQARPCRAAWSKPPRKTELGPPLPSLVAAVALVVDSCPSCAAASLCLCPIDPDPEPLTWYPSWSLALLCHHKHPWLQGLWNGCPSPAPSLGVVGQALTKKILPC